MAYVDHALIAEGAHLAFDRGSIVAGRPCPLASPPIFDSAN